MHKMQFLGAQRQAGISVQMFMCSEHKTFSLILLVSTSWPRGYKTFFVLDSAEHEICPANKSQTAYNCKFFLDKYSWAWKFLC